MIKKSRPIEQILNDQYCFVRKGNEKYRDLKMIYNLSKWFGKINLLLNQYF